MDDVFELRNSEVGGAGDEQPDRDYPRRMAGDESGEGRHYVNAPPPSGVDTLEGGGQLVKRDITSSVEPLAAAWYTAATLPELNAPNSVVLGPKLSGFDHEIAHWQPFIESAPSFPDGNFFSRAVSVAAQAVRLSGRRGRTPKDWYGNVFALDCAAAPRGTQSHLYPLIDD